MATIDPAIRIAIERQWLIGSTVREAIVAIKREHGTKITEGLVLREFARVARKEDSEMKKAILLMSLAGLTACEPSDPVGNTPVVVNPPMPLIPTPQEGMSAPVQGAFLNWFTGGEVPPSPAGLYVGLIDDTSEGTREVTAALRTAGRQALTLADSPPDKGDTAAANPTPLFFAPAQIAVRVTRVGIWDSQEGGSLLFSRTLEEPVSLVPGEGFHLDAGSIRIEVKQS